MPLASAHFACRDIAGSAVGRESQFHPVDLGAQRFQFRLELVFVVDLALDKRFKFGDLFRSIDVS